MAKIQFITGRLAEPALRSLLADAAPRCAIEPVVQVLPISVAALMTPRWVARHLVVEAGVERVVLPGFCQGDLASVVAVAGEIPVVRGPKDLRELPRWLLGNDVAPISLNAFTIEILAEINHAPRLPLRALLEEADRLRAEGADVIDLGCSPDESWREVGAAVRALKQAGHRISIDSFDPIEVERAVEAGAELVLSVNSTNREHAIHWGVEVVVVPDEPHSLDGLSETSSFLTSHGVPHRLDPVLDPIGIGFARSLGRYLAVRQQAPHQAIMMGVGNLTELTDVDSAGVNALLLGFCEELGIGSVLTTEVINWARTSVRELDRARRIMHHAVTQGVPPKRVDPALVALRDPTLDRHGDDYLEALAARIKDPNWRLFAENGQLIAINNRGQLRDSDPFDLFEAMNVDDASHAFYLGYELAKARIALTLSKNYRQDQALDWGYLTEPEPSHRGRRHAKDHSSETESP